MVENEAEGLTIGPDEVPGINYRIAILNRNRDGMGWPRLEMNKEIVHEPDRRDPIIVWETVFCSLNGASPYEIAQLSDGMVSTPERKVKTSSLVDVAASAHRRSHKATDRTAESQQGVIDQVIRYVDEGPSGALRRELFPTRQDQTSAFQFQNWSAGLKPDDDYEAKVLQTLWPQAIPLSDIGVAAHLVDHFFRHHQQKVLGARIRTMVQSQSSTPPYRSQWLGAVAEPIRITARVDLAHPVRNNHSPYPRLLYILRTDRGDLVRWLASETQGFEVGDTVTVEGKVKEHRHFNGERQTDIWYCGRPTIHSPT